MKDWLKISCLLCVFGFMRELRPSEPYFTEFLLGEWRNITEDQLIREVNPLGTYFYLAQLVIVFLITDYLRYKSLIVTIGVSGIIIWSMLLWTTSLEALQVMEFFYGTYQSSEVAYFTYIYAKVDKKYYPRVTSHTRAAMFTGRLVAGISAQFLLNFELMNYKDLNFITLATQIFAACWALSLPKVDKSLYFHHKERSAHVYTISAQNSIRSKDIKVKTSEYGSMDSEDTCKSTENEADEKLVNVSPLQLIWSHFKNAYTNAKVVQWSIWYAVTQCGILQMTAYVQVIWKNIEPEASITWNGAVDAILTALSALCSLAAGYLHAGRFNPRSSLLIVAAIAGLEGGAIFLCCLTTNVFVSYVGYILFGAMNAFSLTVASAEVARHLEEDSYGLVFGINTFFALILQTVLTLVIISESGFALSVKGQYIVYAFYFIIIGFVYFIFIVTEYLLTRNSPASNNIAIE